MTKGNTGSGKIRAPRIEKAPPKIVTEALAAKAGAGKVRAPRIVKTPPKIVTSRAKGPAKTSK